MDLKWLEKFCRWLCLIHDHYGPELREAINANHPIQPCRSQDQTMRSKRLFRLLQQNFFMQVTARLRISFQVKLLRPELQSQMGLNF